MASFKQSNQSKEKTKTIKDFGWSEGYALDGKKRFTTHYRVWTSPLKRQSIYLIDAKYPQYADKNARSNIKNGYFITISEWGGDEKLLAEGLMKTEALNFVKEYIRKK
jgi:hypothetical protein